MIDNILHIGLGAALYEGNGANSGSNSSRSASGSATTSRTITQAQATDPWGLFIVPFSGTTVFGVVVTDGVSNWNIVMQKDETVEDALDDFFTTYYKYSMLPQQNENGTYSSTSTGHATSNQRRGVVGNTTTLHGLSFLTDAFGLTDSKGDAAFDAEYDATNYRVHADSADYNTAMSSHLLRTLNEILATGNLAAKCFYIPAGYYYIGREISTSPYYDYDAAAQAKATGDALTEQLRQSEMNDFVNKNLDDDAPTQGVVMSKKRQVLLALLSVGSLLLFMPDRDDKKRKKR